MPITKQNKIEYWDLQPAKFHEQWVAGNVVVTRPVKVRWRDYIKWRIDVLGFSEWQGRKLHRQIPEEHPIYKGLWAQEVELLSAEGEMVDINPDGTPKFADEPQVPKEKAAAALATITYRAVRQDIFDDDLIGNGQPRFTELNRMVLRRDKAAVQNFTLKGQFARVDVMTTNRPLREVISGIDTKPTQEPPFKTIPFDTLYYQWLDVAAVDGRFPPWVQEGIDACIGKVNLYPFDNLYEPGTMLFHAPEKEEIINSLGKKAFNITFIFERRVNRGNNGRAYGWNSRYTIPAGALKPGFYRTVVSAAVAGKTVYSLLYPPEDFMKPFDAKLLGNKPPDLLPHYER